MTLAAGTTLGPYSVTAKIGEGGMGRWIELARSHRVLPEPIDSVSLPVYQAMLSSLEGGLPLKEL